MVCAGFQKKSHGGIPHSNHPPLPEITLLLGWSAAAGSVIYHVGLSATPTCTRTYAVAGPRIFSHARDSSDCSGIRGNRNNGTFFGSMYLVKLLLSVG